MSCRITQREADGGCVPLIYRDVTEIRLLLLLFPDVSGLQGRRSGKKDERKREREREENEICKRTDCFTFIQRRKGGKEGRTQKGLDINIKYELDYWGEGGKKI